VGYVLNRRRWLLAIATAALTGSALACSAILGIDDKPLRVETDGATPPTDAADAADAAACDPNAVRGCGGACPHDFCDDFDGDGQAPGSRWQPPNGFENPIVQGDSGVTLTAPGNASARSLLARTSSTGSTSFSILVDQLALADRHAGKQFAGVRVAIDLRVDALTFTGKGGPVTDAGSATVIGLLRPDSFPPKGIAIVLTGSSVHLDVSEDALGVTGTEIVADVNRNIDVSKVLNNWVQVELFVGDRDRAVSERFESCKAVARGLVAAAALGGKVLGEACVPVPPGFGGSTWAETPAFLVGGLLFAAGSAAFRVDNAVADFYVK
jgi:hypothetical protein